MWKNREIQLTLNLSFRADVVELTTLLASLLTAVENSSRSRFTNCRTSTDCGQKYSKFNTGSFIDMKHIKVQ
jgi:hypothetical protein